MPALLKPGAVVGEIVAERAVRDRRGSPGGVRDCARMAVGDVAVEEHVVHAQRPRVVDAGAAAAHGVVVEDPGVVQRQQARDVRDAGAVAQAQAACHCGIARNDAALEQLDVAA